MKTLVSRLCLACHAPFKAVLADLRRGERSGAKTGQYCSRACASLAACKIVRVVDNPAYGVWAGMIQRVSNVNLPEAPNYILRGIDCDPRWRSFQIFISDMGPRPDGASLDRINNDGGYWPGNCRWTFRAEQSRNTRRNNRVMLHGQSLVMKDALRTLGYSYQAYYYLRNKHGMLPQQAVDYWLGRNGAKAGERHV